jgi:hypothetical protein
MSSPPQGGDDIEAVRFIRGEDREHALRPLIQTRYLVKPDTFRVVESERIGAGPDRRGRGERLGRLGARATRRCRGPDVFLDPAVGAAADRPEQRHHRPAGCQAEGVTAAARVEADRAALDTESRLQTELSPRRYQQPGNHGLEDIPVGDLTCSFASCGAHAGLPGRWSSKNR